MTRAMVLELARLIEVKAVTPDVTDTGRPHRRKRVTRDAWLNRRKSPAQRYFRRRKTQVS